MTASTRRLKWRNLSRQPSRVTSVISLLCLGSVCLIPVARLWAAETRAAKEPLIHVRSCADFDVTGLGDSAAWKQADWVKMNRRPKGSLDYETRFKILYSSSGIYVLFDGTDKTLTATMTDDFLDLWNEDVFECFFWTDEQYPLYFEYEISPLGYELPILVPNLGGKYLGWRPWHYDGTRRTRKAVTISGGKRESNAKISGWRAEVFMPYELLAPLTNMPPKPGTRWRANFYRIDYDGGLTTGWDWARVGPSFHEFRKFGTLVFD